MKSGKISLVVKFLGALALPLVVLGRGRLIGTTGLTRGGEQTADVAGARGARDLEELASRYKLADGNGNGAPAGREQEA